MIEFLKHIDYVLFTAINQLHNPFFDFIMYWLSNTYIWIPLYLVLIAFIIKKHRLKSLVFIVAIILLIIIVDQSSVQLFKNVFQRLRPCHDPILEGMVHIVRGHCGGRYGFVSSHAANTFALAVFTSLLFRNNLFTILILLWAIIISYSRIYLGVHFPVDVSGGAILGSGLAIGMFYICSLVIRKIWGYQLV